MREVDKIRQDAAGLAGDVGENLAQAVDELVKEVRRLTRPEPKIPTGLVVVIALALIGLAAAILGGMRAMDQSRSNEYEELPYA